MGIEWEGWGVPIDAWTWLHAVWRVHRRITCGSAKGSQILHMMMLSKRATLCRASNVAPSRPCSLASGRLQRGTRHAVVAHAGEPIAPAGQVNAELMASMTANITEALQAKKALVTDVYGDGRHVQIEVVSPLFEGKSQMNRQRMVYKVSLSLRLPTIHEACTTAITQGTSHRSPVLTLPHVCSPGRPSG
jgi:stress-induced morphogen